MPWWSGMLFLAFVLVNNGVTLAQGPSTSLWGKDFNNKKSQPPIDIQFDNDPSPMDLLAAGSGQGPFFPTDDEDFGLSGSGSGSGYGDLETDEVDPPTRPSTRRPTNRPRTPGTPEPLTDCQLARHKNRMLKKRMPDCLPNGDYAPMQCSDSPSVADCWCVDLNNAEVHGTRMDAPNVPSCEDGGNLSPCVFDLVQASRMSMLGAFRPRCTRQGLYHRAQCQGSVCYCVDEDTGHKEAGTEVALPARPDCDTEEESSFDKDDTVEVDGNFVDTSEETDEGTEGVTLYPPYKKPNKGEGEAGTGVDPQIVFPDSEGPDGENVNIDGSERDDTHKEEEGQGSNGKDNMTGEDAPELGRQGEEEEKSSVETAGEIMTQPGILAGIIGGGVVLLLCLVLLIMFIVYRMRKKDEGSYPLDEPRRPANYTYVRTPDREFYA